MSKFKSSEVFDILEKNEYEMKIMEQKIVLEKTKEKRFYILSVDTFVYKFFMGLKFRFWQESDRVHSVSSVQF